MTTARSPAAPRSRARFSPRPDGLGPVPGFFRPESSLLNPVIFAVLGIVLHFVAFGLDPMRDKGWRVSTRSSGPRGPRGGEAEKHLAAMSDAIKRAGDRRCWAGSTRLQTTAREMFRTVEEDPRDLTAARKYLGVYLLGARDATIKFADIYARTRDPQARDGLRGAARRSGKEFRRAHPRRFCWTTAPIWMSRSKCCATGWTAKASCASRDQRERPACPKPSAKKPQPTWLLSKEVTAVILPEPSPQRACAAGQGRPPRSPRRSSTRMAEIDMGDTGSIVEFRLGRAGGIAGDQPGDAGGCAQQGCRPRGRQPARDRHHDPRVFGIELDVRRKPSAGGNGCSAAPHPSPNSWPATKTCRARSTRSPTTCWATSTSC